VKEKTTTARRLDKLKTPALRTDLSESWGGFLCYTQERRRSTTARVVPLIKSRNTLRKNVGASTKPAAPLHCNERAFACQNLFLVDVYWNHSPTRSGENPTAYLDPGDIETP